MFKKSALLGSLFLLSFSLNAQTPLKAWSATSAAVSNAVDTVQSLIASAYSGDPQGLTTPGNGFVGLYRGPAFATYIQVLSDNAAAKLQFYQSTNQIAVQPTNGLNQAGSNYVALGGTNFGVSYILGSTYYGPISSNSVLSNAVCVIRHKAADTYERNRIWGPISGTNVIFAYPLTTTIGAGDIVYVYTPSATYSVATNTSVLINAVQGQTTFTQSGAPGVANGVVPGTPFLIDLTGGTKVNTNAINASGGFLP